MFLREFPRIKFGSILLSTGFTVRQFGATSPFYIRAHPWSKPFSARSYPVKLSIVEMKVN